MLLESIYALAAFLVGAAVGYAFNLLQQTALRRNEERQRAGKFNSGWTLIPGSGGRVALLLITLVLIQLVCPILFRDGIQWWVSGGVIAGYGSMLFRQLMIQRRRARA